MKMADWEGWQLRRIVSSQREDITCDVWEPLPQGTFLFGVIGSTREPYDVLIEESALLWPPSCTCADNTFRPSFLCKHICFVLVKLGAREESLADSAWTPAQDDIYEGLSSAPEAID